MKVLVTGGAGFIASHITDALIEHGHEVIVVDNLSSGKMEFVNPKAVFYNLDITNDGLEEVFRRHRPHVVDHHAAQKEVTKSVRDPIFDARVNIIGTLNLLENCVRYGVEKFIFASSGGTVYGEPVSLPVGEDHPERPFSPYAVAKLSAEHYLRFYHRVHGLNYVSLRYANIYGPRQDPYGEAGVVAIFTLRLLEGKPAIIYGDGEQVRDFIFVEDAVAANLAALELAAPAAVTANLGTSTGTSVNVLLQKLCKPLGCQFDPVYEPAREGEIRAIYLSSECARAVLRWTPKVSLEEGLARTIESFRRNDP